METIDPFAQVPAPLRAAIEARGFEKLTAVQEAVLSAEGEGRNLRISSQTGSGKTLALGLRLASDLIPQDGQFLPPADGPRALLITPTRELAVQVAEELRWLLAQVPGVTVEVVTGGSDPVREKRALKKSPAVLVGTPGRLLDHIRTGNLRCSSIRQVVLDEADQMLDMGFREELEAILENLPQERYSHLVSATFPQAVKKLADGFQKNPLIVEGTRLGEANADIQHIAHLIRPRELERALTNVLLHSEGERVLIFVRRRVDAADLTERLSAKGLAAAPFSGELTQAQRTRTLNAFRHGEQKILIATDVAARGIDIPGIGMVIHADIPTDVENYTHRSGRTGRAGQKGRSILMVPLHLQGRVRRVLSQAGVEPQWQPIPSRAQIEKRHTKLFRRDLHAQLAEPDEVSEKQKSYAKFLLEQPEGRTPEEIIAALLQMAEPAPSNRGYDLEKITEKPGRHSDQRRSHDRRSHDRRNHFEDQGLRKRDLSGNFDVFEINWGFHNGGNASRILSHICRRGKITRAAIGQISVGTGSSIFEVSDTVSMEFEKACGRPDSRDPDLIVQRSKKTLVSRRPRRPKSDRGKGHRSFGGREKAGSGRR
ncbi:MAG: DEAD/DEAH box helicase [Planctomycetes bacterium]|nr:DEAD/DEAH box helicase [Planctomycetota bacterium]